MCHSMAPDLSAIAIVGIGRRAALHPRGALSPYLQQTVTRASCEPDSDQRMGGPFAPNAMARSLQATRNSKRFPGEETVLPQG